MEKGNKYVIVGKEANIKARNQQAPAEDAESNESIVGE